MDRNLIRNSGVHQPDDSLDEDPQQLKQQSSETCTDFMDQVLLAVDHMHFSMTDQDKAQPEPGFLKRCPSWQLGRCLLAVSRK